MRILYHHRTVSRDGMDIHIREMVSAFRDMGHDVKVVGPHASRESAFGSEGGFISEVKKTLPASIVEILELGHNLISFSRLAYTVYKFKPDLIYERYNLHFLSGALLRKLTKIPFFLEVNAPLVEERKRYGKLGLKWLANWSQKQAWRAADQIFSVSGPLTKRIIAAGIPKTQIHTTPNGVNLEKFNNIKKGWRTCLSLDDKIILGFSGFARPWHGLDRVLSYMARKETDDQLHFLIVGDSPIIEDLKRQVYRLKIQDKVTFAGLVSREHIATYLSCFDIALQPHAVEYSSPLKLLEYMAAGHAIIAPDQENIRELVTHGESALLFDFKAEDDFANTVSKLVTNPELRKGLGDTARETITERNLTWMQNARQVTEMAAAHQPKTYMSQIQKRGLRQTKKA